MLFWSRWSIMYFWVLFSSYFNQNMSICPLLIFHPNNDIFSLMAYCFFVHYLNIPSSLCWFFFFWMVAVFLAVVIPKCFFFFPKDYIQNKSVVWCSLRMSWLLSTKGLMWYFYDLSHCFLKLFRNYLLYKWITIPGYRVSQINIIIDHFNC